MRQRGVLVTNSAGVHAVPIAEFVLAGVLHFLRGLDLAAEQQRAARWDRTPFLEERSELRELGECRLLVVGTGGIGTAVAERATALGARCVGLRRHPDRPHSPAFARVAGLEALDAELPAADILVLAVPLTGHTRALMSAERLDRLPPGAILVNVARGQLVDERALADRLATGTLRGAVLDVFEVEPLPPDSPLWGLRRALVTPHVSGVSPRRFWEREVALILENWSRYQRRDPLRNLVDLEAGY
jgi:phosphoglycerate dehydrogenase-like enzyme